MTAQSEFKAFLYTAKLTEADVEFLSNQNTRDMTIYPNYSITRCDVTLMHFVCVPACNNDGLLSIPGWIISHDFSMCGDILGRQLRRFIGLSVDPTKGLHFL